MYHNRHRVGRRRIIRRLNSELSLGGNLMPKRSFSFMYFRSLAAKIALGLGIVLISHAAAQAADVPIRVAYIPTANLLPAFVANDEGIFQKNGLAVTLTPTQNSSMLPGTLG